MDVAVTLCKGQQVFAGTVIERPGSCLSGILTMQSCFPAPCPPGSQPCFTCCALLRWCLAAGRQGVRLQVWHHLPLVPPEDAGGERDLHPPRLRQGQAPALHLLVSLGHALAMRVGMLCGGLCVQGLLTSVCKQL